MKTHTITGSFRFDTARVMHVLVIITCVAYLITINFLYNFKRKKITVLHVI